MKPNAALLLLRGLDILALGLELAPAIRAAFQDITHAVQRMVEENRDPTDAEVWKLDALRDAVHAAIQDAHPHGGPRE